MLVLPWFELVASLSLKHEWIYLCTALLASYRSHKYSISLTEGALHYLMKYLKVSLTHICTMSVFVAALHLIFELIICHIKSWECTAVFCGLMLLVERRYARNVVQHLHYKYNHLQVLYSRSLVWMIDRNKSLKNALKLSCLCAFLYVLNASYAVLTVIDDDDDEFGNGDSNYVVITMKFRFISHAVLLNCWCWCWCWSITLLCADSTYRQVVCRQANHLGM